MVLACCNMVLRLVCSMVSDNHSHNMGLVLVVSVALVDVVGMVASAVLADAVDVVGVDGV